jgi:simple sugar transport system ATP-binding protein
VGDRVTAETNPDELLALMIGQRSAAPGVLSELGVETPAEGPRPAYLVGRGAGPGAAAMPTLEVREASVANRRGALAVRGVSLEVMPGEVLGVAGVDGSGQRELAEAIVGLRPLRTGSVRLDGKEIGHSSVGARLRAGITFVPEDRHREGLVLDFSLAENLLLGRERERRFGGGPVLDLGNIDAFGNATVRASRVKAPSATVPARSLSGGNQQKVVIARALQGDPRLLVAMQPTRGLDVEATRFVYEQFREARAKGLGILLFSLDLDEVFAISDRIAVMFDGRLMGIVNRAEATTERIGQMMVGRAGDAA